MSSSGISVAAEISLADFQLGQLMANKKSSPDQATAASSWDLEAFEQQVQGDSNWSQGSSSRKKKKKANRLQDIAITNLDTPPSSPQVTKTNETSSTWPFESSPCRMFGGKNTRAASTDDGDSKNEQLFDAKFADRSVNKRMVSDPEEEDEETSIEDEFTSEDLILGESDDDSDSSVGTGGAKEDLHRTGLVRNDRAESPSQRKNANDEKSNARPASRGKSASPQRTGSERKTRLSRTKRDTATVSSASKPVPKMEKKASPPKKQDKPKAGSGLEKQIKTDRSNRRKPDKPRSHSTSEDLMSVSHHGGTSGGSRVRRGLNRAKSSDGMEGFSGGSSENTWSRKGGKRDDLSSASLHTSASLGRSSRSSSVRRDGNSARPSVAMDRRSKFARAMSTSNVKRPEEYAHSETKNENKISQSISERRKTSKPSSSSASVPSRDVDEQLAASVEAKGETTKISQFLSDKRKTSKNSSSASVVSRESTASVSRAAKADNEDTTTGEDGEQPRSSSKTRPTMRRKRSQRFGRSGSSRSISSSKQTEGDGKSGNALSSSTNDGGKSSRRSSRERRDLMVLLREKKSIQPVDLMDKENRKMLHFLMYEHKMGISQDELQQRIRKEKESS